VAKPDKKPPQVREATVRHVENKARDYTVLDNALFMPACNGSTASVVTFCARPVRCLLCSAKVSNCLRKCADDNSMTESLADLIVCGAPQRNRRN
jgi:hypothetical protein